MPSKWKTEKTPMPDISITISTRKCAVMAHWLKILHWRGGVFLESSNLTYYNSMKGFQKDLLTFASLSIPA